MSYRNEKASCKVPQGTIADSTLHWLARDKHIRAASRVRYPLTVRQIAKNFSAPKPWTHSRDSSTGSATWRAIRTRSGCPLQPTGSTRTLWRCWRTSVCWFSNTRAHTLPTARIPPRSGPLASSGNRKAMVRASFSSQKIWLTEGTCASSSSTRSISPEPPSLFPSRRGVSDSGTLHA